MRGRGWETISAVVDIVSVTPQTMQDRGNERIIGYISTLTYFYRNPELEVGEFSRVFNTQPEAESWAASYKGRNIMVHLDPRDPTQSVVRKEEL